MDKKNSLLMCIAVATALISGRFVVAAAPTTWDGRHPIDQIEVTVVYFTPRDRDPLPDWRQRVEYYCRRIERFHAREYQDQSKLVTKIHGEPFRSRRTTDQLRAGDANFIFFQTLREVDRGLDFATGAPKAFPILLVMSEINWRDLDDFYRLKPKAGGFEFEGQFINSRHFPGAKSGGARATYLADPGKGWGLVSADGWRVPYSGTDCVVYHEGVGHTVGLPHPKKANGSVMSMGQYRGWINESWLDDDQKEHLGWVAPEKPVKKDDLFSTFTAIPEPLVPRPGQDAHLRLKWPAGAQLSSLRVQLQTAVTGPWVETVSLSAGETPDRILIGNFDRPTPVSYRVDAKLVDGQDVELWGYFQVRADLAQPPLPIASTAAAVPEGQPRWDDSVELLPLIDVDKKAVAGKWRKAEGILESNKQYGARIQIPYSPPEEYRLSAVVRPLDEPNGLILGQRVGGKRFVVLVNHRNGADAKAVSAIENVDGRNFVGNPTTIRADLLKKDRVSTIVCTVLRDGVSVTCDGREIIRWHGNPDQLSLSDYWKTPNDKCLFLGAYDCRYRFERVTLTPISKNR